MVDFVEKEKTMLDVELRQTIQRSQQQIKAKEAAINDVKFCKFDFEWMNEFDIFLAARSSRSLFKTFGCPPNGTKSIGHSIRSNGAK